MATGIRFPGLDPAAGTFTPTAGYVGAPTKGTPAATGTEGIAPSAADFDIEGALSSIRSMGEPDAPSTPQATDPFIAVNPATKRVYVNGFEFAENDAASALQSREYLSQPGKPFDNTQGWQSVPRSLYESYLSSIEDPDIGTTFTKNVASASGGYIASLGEFILVASGGKAGADMVASGNRTQERLSPFVKSFTQVKTAEDAAEFFVGSVAQMVPYAAESVLSAIAGGLVGGAIGTATAPGPGTAVGAVGGAAAGIAAKATLSAVIRKQFAGEILSATERQLLYKATGAYLGTVTTGYTQGAGQVRSEQRAKGVQDEPGAVASALVGGVPYALLNSVPEFAAGWAAFSRAAATGSLGSRFGKGVAIGAGLEGSTEVAQDAIAVGSAESLGAQYTDAEKTTRWIDSFAAGAVVGGAIGGPVNLMRPRADTKKTPPPAAAPTTPAAPAPPAAPQPIDMSGLADMEDPGIPTADNQPELPAGERPAYDPGTPGFMGGFGDDAAPGAPQIFPDAPAPIVEPVADTGPTNIANTEQSVLPVPEGQVPAQRGGTRVAIRTTQANPIVALPPEEPVAPAGPKPGNLFPDDEMGPPRLRTNLVGLNQGQPLVDEAAPQPPAVESGQQALLTEKGAPTPEVKKAVLFGATKVKPGTKGAKALLQMVRVTKGQVTEEAAGKLGSADGVSIQPFNLDSLFNKKTKNVVKLRFGVGGSNIEIAYDEDKYGSPQAFAEAMGIDYALFDTGTYQRTNKAGRSSEPLPVTEYSAPTKVTPAPAERAAKRTLRPTKVEEAPEPKGTKRAIQKRSAAPVAAEKQAGRGEGDGSPDTAGREAPRSLKRKPEQAAQPRAETQEESARAVAVLKPKTAKSAADAAIDEKMKEVDAKLAAAQERLRKAAEEQNAKSLKLEKGVTTRQKKEAEAEAARENAVEVGKAELKKAAPKSLKKDDAAARKAETKMEKAKEVEARLYDTAMKMDFEKLKDEVETEVMVPSQAYAYTRAYIVRLAEKNLDEAVDFIDPEIADMEVEWFARAVKDATADLKKKGVDLAGKKPGNKPRFSTVDDGPPELPSNVISFDEDRARQKKGSPRSFDLEKDLTSIQEERAKRGLRPFKPNAAFWDTMTESERERAIEELQEVINLNAQYEKVREELMRKRRDELIKEHLLWFRPGELVHIEDEKKRSVPWKVLDYLIDPTDKDRYGYVMWHPLHGAQRVYVNDVETSLYATQTQTKWDMASEKERRVYDAAENAGMHRLLELAEETRSPEEKMAVVRKALTDAGYKTGDNILVNQPSGEPKKYQLGEVVFSQSRGIPGVVITDPEGVKNVLTMARPEAEIAAWTKMGIRGPVDPTGKYSLSEFDTVTPKDVFGRYKMRIARLMANARAAGVKIHVFKNQIDLRNNDPGLYNRASLARQKDLSLRLRGIDEAPAEFLADIDDPQLDAIRDKLYTHREKFLVNPTNAEILGLPMGDFGPFIKFLVTKRGNVVAFSSETVGEHIDAYAMLGWRGEYGRGYYSLDYNTMTPREYAESEHVITTMGQQFVVDEKANAVPRSRIAPPSTQELETREALELAEGDPALQRALNTDLREIRRRARWGVVNDFDTVKAAGYSFGNNEVIIFTDRIENDAHLDFVFAHEVSGHVGLAGIIGNANMATAMDMVYDYSPNIRAMVEARRLSHDLTNKGVPFSKAEAVEEALADMQGRMETDIAAETFLQKLVRTLKEFFAQMGLVQFEDHHVHMLLLNARRFVRTGKVRPHAFVNSEVAAQATRRSRNAPRFSRTRDPLPVDETWFSEDLGKPDSQLNRIARLVKALYSNEEVLVQMKERYGSEIKMSSLKVYMAKIRNVHGVALPYNTARDVTDKMQLILDAAEALYNETGKLPPIKDIAKKLTDDGFPTSLQVVSQYFSRLRAEYRDKNQSAPPWIAERPRGFAAGGLGVPGDNRTRNAGRYSLANPVEFGQAAGTMNRNMYDMKFSMPTVLQDSLEFLGGVGTNLREVASRVLSEIKTMNFSARSNEGYQEGYQILNDTANLISQLRTKYNAMLEDLLHEANRQTVLQVSEMLQFTSITKLPSATDKMLKELGSLLTVVNGEVIVDVEAFARMKAMGRYTLEEFRQGMEVEYEDVVVLDDGTIAKKKFKKTIAAIPDITEDSRLWKLYQKTRDAMDEAAIDRVKADYFAATGERKNVFRRLGAVINRRLTAADEKLITDIDVRYRQIARENATENADGSFTYSHGAVEKAETLMGKFNAVIIAKTDDAARIREFAEMFPEDQRAAMTAAVTAFRQGVSISDTMKYEAQRIISNMAVLELGKEDSELYAKRSIVGGYVPIGRQGSWQVRVVARDDEGRVVAVKDEFRRQLPYFQVADRAAAGRLAADVASVMGDDLKMTLPVFDKETQSYVVKEVKLEAIAEAARTTPTGDTRINLNEFVRLMSRFGVNLTPAARERIVVGMTEQNARARQNLLRENTPGQDPNSIPYISQHLEALANISGRRQNQHRIDILLDGNDSLSQMKWHMDEGKLKTLEARVDALRASPVSTAAQVAAAQREFDAYNFAYRRTHETGGGNKWKDKFVRDMAYLNEQKALDYSDFASDGAAADIKTFTSVAQLGGSFATAALNIASLPLNVMPALSFYNSKNAFGGGFGMARSAAELTKALGQVGGFGKYRADYYRNLLSDPAALRSSGLTRDEAEFLMTDIEQGNLQAAASNALTASARGKFAGNANTQKFIDAYMSGFTYTEQASRRGAALAAFRMARERAITEGKSSQEANDIAATFAADLIKQTLGQYSMFNRPAFFRGGLQQFIFMYKMYPITTVQLLSALPPQGQAAMLLALWMTAGMKGMPFGEDMLDLLDTILQMLGIKVGSAEGFITSQVDAIAPGMSAYVMRGIVDQVAPFTLSTRMSLGNMIPGTSVGVAGSDPYREITEVLGPAYSAMEGMTKLGVNLTKGTASLIGLSDREVELSTLLRDNPVTLARAIGDTMTYMDTGAIVDSKGYIISEEVSAGVLASRLLGFYPSEATRQNDIIRMGKRTSDYQRAVSTEFRLKYVRAALAGDDGKVRDVIQDVRQWNEAAKGTGLEISNFTMNANRALREAKKSATARFEKSAPKTVRPLVEEYRDAYGMEE